MKTVEEYMIDDITVIKEQACKIAMATIHHIYTDRKEDEHICYDDICSVKKAVEVLSMCGLIK